LVLQGINFKLHSVLMAASALAQVRFPGGFYYVMYAENHLGFLVQRRYRRLPTDNTTEFGSHAMTGAWYKPYLQPFLHPGLVARAGVERAVLQQWLDEHPDEVFTHPYYSSLCLRWGLNALSHHVQAYRELLPYAPEGWDGVPVPFTRPLYFTPRTAWENSGRTYYQLQESVPASECWPTKAGLHWHEADQEGEGSWTGWYTHDWEVVQAAAAMIQQRRYAALCLPRRDAPVHLLQLYQAPGLLVEELTEQLPELAWAKYEATPTVMQAAHSCGSHHYPRLVLSIRSANGQQRIYAGKGVEHTVSLTAIPQHSTVLLAPQAAFVPLDIELPTILKPDGEWQ
jgi:hypothetical protein